MDNVNEPCGDSRKSARKHDLLLLLLLLFHTIYLQGRHLRGQGDLPPWVFEGKYVCQCIDEILHLLFVTRSLGQSLPPGENWNDGPDFLFIILIITCNLFKPY